MNVVYSEPFQKQYDALPPTSQVRFKLVDAQVKSGDLGILRRNDWVYYIGVGGGFIAWGKPVAEDEFLWVDVALPARVPIIL
jgi:hypothetical protein